MDKPITTFNELPDKPRLSQILGAFDKKYGKKAQFVARAPGRVSIQKHYNVYVANADGILQVSIIGGEEASYMTARKNSGVKPLRYVRQSISTMQVSS